MLAKIEIIYELIFKENSEKVPYLKRNPLKIWLSYQISILYTEILFTKIQASAQLPRNSLLSSLNPDKMLVSIGMKFELFYSAENNTLCQIFFERAGEARSLNIYSV